MVSSMYDADAFNANKKYTLAGGKNMTVNKCITQAK